MMRPPLWRFFEIRVDREACHSLFWEVPGVANTIDRVVIKLRKLLSSFVIVWAEQGGGIRWQKEKRVSVRRIVSPAAAA